MTERVYIGLGSNLNNPADQLQKAIAILKADPLISNLRVSPLFKSKPVGPENQPDFINAVARFDTNYESQALLDTLQNIEHLQGRERLIHWGPRTLDLDILLYGNHCINTPRLRIPHPEMMNRAFVLKPLSSLEPEFVFSDGLSIEKALNALPIDALISVAALEND